jgi:hypothetical protein
MLCPGSSIISSTTALERYSANITIAAIKQITATTAAKRNSRNPESDEGMQSSRVTFNEPAIGALARKIRPSYWR